jgi:hypothetical protein
MVVSTRQGERRGPGVASARSEVLSLRPIEEHRRSSQEPDTNGGESSRALADVSNFVAALLHRLSGSAQRPLIEAMWTIEQLVGP